MARIPRWIAPFLWTFGLLLVHVAAPYGLSKLSDRHGWSPGGPGAWNFAPLIFVIGGFAVIVWALTEHFEHAPHGWRGWQMTLKPQYLIVGGPYRYGRNPMYVAALAIWIGWALFYGSVAVLAGFAMLWVVIVRIVVPSEERAMATTLGEPYSRYQGRVSRWFGRTSG